MTNTNINESIRANKLTVKTIESGVGYQADFYRTHKHIATLKSTETSWLADPDANKSANRESFRKFAIEHSEHIGVTYDPEDRRSQRNHRFPTYADDCAVKIDVTNMLHNDIMRFIGEDTFMSAENTYGIELIDIIMESITAKTHTGKGTDLTTLHITDGKYLNGNWAWADIELLANFNHTASGQTFQMLYPMELVSGQLKKSKLTKTLFNDGIYEELLAMGLVEKKPTKEEKSVKAKKSDKVGLGDAEHEGLHIDMTPAEEAAAMEEADRVLAEMDAKAKKSAKEEKPVRLKKDGTPYKTRKSKKAAEEQVEG